MRSHQLAFQAQCRQIKLNEKFGRGVNVPWGAIIVRCSNPVPFHPSVFRGAGPTQRVSPGSGPPVRWEQGRPPGQRSRCVQLPLAEQRTSYRAINGCVIRDNYCSEEDKLRKVMVAVFTPRRSAMPLWCEGWGTSRPRLCGDGSCSLRAPPQPLPPAWCRADLSVRGALFFP